MMNSIRNISLSCIFLLLIFIMCLENLTSNTVLKFVLKHIDEFMVVALWIFILIHIKYLIKNKKNLFIVLCIFNLLGIVSSIVFRYQDIYASIIDCVLIVNRFILGYIAVYIYILINKKTISESFYLTARIVTIFLFLIAVHDLFMPPFFDKADFRYFMNSLKLMFPHATYLAATGITLLIYFGYKNDKMNNLKYMFMASFLALVTLRVKAVGFVIVYWLMYLCVFFFKVRNFFFILVGGAVVALLIGIDQVKEYFFESEYSPRLILLKDSIQLAASHFPLGTGFGTFGSSMAADHYSILYTQLGYEKYWGMSSENNVFLMDSFWPIIIAQFGFVGLLIFGFVLYYLIMRSLKIIKVESKAGFAMLLIMIDMIINSMAETAFFNPTALLLFGIYGICEGETELKVRGYDK